MTKKLIYILVISCSLHSFMTRTCLTRVIENIVTNAHYSQSHYHPFVYCKALHSYLKNYIVLLKSCQVTSYIQMKQYKVFFLNLLTVVYPKMFRREHDMKV